MAGCSLGYIQSNRIGRRLLGLPIRSRAAIHRMGKVVSGLTQALPTPHLFLAAPGNLPQAMPGSALGPVLTCDNAGSN